MAEPNTKAQNLRIQLQQCNGFEGDEIAKAREQALNYYFQRVRGDEQVGRSDVVSGDVSAMVEATAAQMVESFSSDKIVEFDPMDADDEDQAQLESDAVQWYVMGRENGFLEIVSAIKETLLLRNGVIMVDAEEKTTRRVKNFRNVEVEAYAELRAQPDVVADKYDSKTGQLQLTFERTAMDFKMQSISLENFLYHNQWHKQTLEGIPVCAVRHITTRAELVSLGISAVKANKLTAHRSELQTESTARNPRTTQPANKPFDDTQELVEWYDIYIRQQAKGGIDELRRVRFSYRDSEILSDDPAPFVKLATGVAILNPHRLTGISLYDKLKQSQDFRTQLRRALADNVNATTKNRTAGLDGVVNEDDITDGRVNNHVRIKNTVQDVRQALMAFSIPDTSANILAALESSGRERGEMGGAALDLQSAQLQIGGDRMGSQGLDRAYSVAEQLSAFMLKLLAATLIRSVFLLAHNVLREYFDQELPFKRKGKWTYTKPSQWPERVNATIKPGMSPGERTRRSNAMAEVINSQMMLADKGMDEVLVNIKGFHRAMMDWARLNDIQNPEQYYVDPDSPESQTAMQNKNKAAAEAKNQKAALMQQAFGLEQLRTAFQKYVQDSDLQFKYFDSILGSEVDEAKIAGDAALQLIKGRNNGSQEASGAIEPESTAAGDTSAAES